MLTLSLEAIFRNIGGRLVLKVPYWAKYLSSAFQQWCTCVCVFTNFICSLRKGLMWQPRIQLVVAHHTHAHAHGCCTALFNSDCACCSDIEALLLCCVTVSLQSNTSTRHKAAKQLRKKERKKKPPVPHKLQVFLPFFEKKFWSQQFVKGRATVRHSLIHPHPHPTPPPSPPPSPSHPSTIRQHHCVPAEREETYI